MHNLILKRIYISPQNPGRDLKSEPHQYCGQNLQEKYSGLHISHSFCCRDGKTRENRDMQNERDMRSRHSSNAHYKINSELLDFCTMFKHLRNKTSKSYEKSCNHI